ncbi:MAG: Uma2 family endonuclease [Candidatus Riflebacteria bacterium]
MAGRTAGKKEIVESYNYGDYEKWKDSSRWEIIDGHLYAMVPAPNTDHQTLLVNLCVAVGAFLKGHRCKLFVAPYDVLLPKGDEADELVKTVLQPDLAVVCDEKKLSDKSCRGAPDWVIEIISPSTAGRDQIIKKRIYEGAGVKEYWIFSPHDRIVFVYLLHKNKFTLSDIYDETAKIEVKTLPGLVIDCGEIFPPRPAIEVREPPEVYI